MNFLYEVFSRNKEVDNIYYFVARDSGPHKFLVENKYKKFSVLPRNPVKRILFELLYSKKILKNNEIDIIYSYFGFGLYNKRIKQISGSADSNLFFPNIDFWSEYKGISKLKKRLIDLYRIYGLKRCDAIVYENPIMHDKGKKLFNIERSVYIKPSISLSTFNTNLKDSVYLQNDFPSGLFLCGWQLNKNIMLVPEIAKYLKAKSFPFNFVITAPNDNSNEERYFNNLVSKFCVEEYISRTGVVDKDNLPSLYNNIDYVFYYQNLKAFQIT